MPRADACCMGLPARGTCSPGNWVALANPPESTRPPASTRLCADTQGAVLRRSVIYRHDLQCYIPRSRPRPRRLGGGGEAAAVGRVYRTHVLALDDGQANVNPEQAACCCVAGPPTRPSLRPSPMGDGLGLRLMTVCPAGNLVVGHAVRVEPHLREWAGAAYASHPCCIRTVPWPDADQVLSSLSLLAIPRHG